MAMIETRFTQQPFGGFGWLFHFVVKHRGFFLSVGNYFHIVCFFYISLPITILLYEIILLAEHLYNFKKTSFLILITQLREVMKWRLVSYHFPSRFFITFPNYLN